MARIDTQLIHAGEPHVERSVALPIFSCSNYIDPEEITSYADIRYIRLNNTPNANAVSAKVAAAEGTEAAVVMASGMAAISTTLLTVLSAGDHILLRRGVYGGTFTLLVHDLERLGIAATVVEDDVSTWEAATWPG